MLIKEQLTVKHICFGARLRRIGLNETVPWHQWMNEAAFIDQIAAAAAAPTIHASKLVPHKWPARHGMAIRRVWHPQWKSEDEDMARVKTKTELSFQCHFLKQQQDESAGWTVEDRTRARFLSLFCLLQKQAYLKSITYSSHPSVIMQAKDNPTIAPFRPYFHHFWGI